MHGLRYRTADAVSLLFTVLIYKFIARFEECLFATAQNNAWHLGNLHMGNASATGESGNGTTGVVMPAASAPAY